MNTGGKVATGILVPLAVVGAVVGGWFLFGRSTRKRESKDDESKDDTLKQIEKEWHDTMKAAGMPIIFKNGGKRRRTHKKRR